ncbi:isoamyl alcohol oxidase [Aspergillus ustus]|uniref:Flavin-dependent oxygenase ucdF n=1 Tax=Aspergillus ustus TaxID=40382 RepID=UCDF_ASPUT|nr:isoamyl alcohol oxidase [Aspergillus ustus]
MHRWTVFNEEINGNLVRVRPVGSVCHGIEFDEMACASVKSSTHNSLWRISEPGALQATNWESEHGFGSCVIDSSKDTPCRQGRIPYYAVMAQTPQHIQTAIQFARHHNLRVAIRNTGHDAIGRSSGRGSLQINVSGLKGIHFLDDFIPQGGYESQGQAVTVGAGVLGIELLTASRIQGVNVVTGTCSSVAATGGYLQGGGTSMLGPAYGMASDNALEFHVITAMGDTIVVNQYQNTDLFWSLRGGGGGTFGVVVNTTIRTFPDVPAVHFLLSSTIHRDTETSLDAEQSLWEITAEIAKLLPDLKRFNNATSSIIVPIRMEDRVTVTAEILLVNTSDIHSAGTYFTRLIKTLDSQGFPYTSNLTLYPQLSTYLSQQRVLDRAGYGIIEGSVLVSEDLFFHPDGISDIMLVLSSLQLEVGDSVEIFMCAGGQVKANKGRVTTALLPTWREAVLLLTIRRTLPPSSMIQRMRNSQLPRLRSLESPYLGSYLNVADPDEPDFRKAFWGDHYSRLYQIKHDRDPNGLFIVRIGVGSEDWDMDGICQFSKMQ